MPELSPLLRFLIPPLACVLVFLLQLRLLRHTQIAPFVFFFVAVALSAWLGGRIPGLLAVVLSAALANNVFMGSRGWSTSGPELTATVLYVIASSVVALLCAAFREAALRAQQAAQERAHVRDELLQKEQRLRVVFENVALGIAEVDRDARLENVNQRLCEMLGYRREELIGISIAQLTAPEDLELTADLDGKLLRGELDHFDCEKRYLNKNGAPIWVHVRVTAVKDSSGRPQRAVGTIEDITARKLAEEARRDAHDRYQQQVRLFDSVASTTPDFVYLFDREGRFQYANRRLLEVWGMRLADVLGKTCRELGYEQWHHDMHMREIAQVIRTKLPIKGEVPFKAPLTGIFGVYEYIFTPVIGPAGEVEFVSGTTRDVTERKHSEEALRRSEREYRTLAENAPEVIARFDRDLRHTYINEYGAKVYGVPRDQVIGKSNAELGMPADKVAFWKQHFEFVFESGEQRTVDFQFDSPTYGHQFFSSLFVPERDDLGQVRSILAITRDVTSLRSAEEALRSSQAWLEAERNRLQTIVDTIPAGLFLLDGDGRAALVNGEAKRIWAGTGRLASVADFVEYKAFWPDTGRRLGAEDWPAAQALFSGRSIKGVILDIERFDGTRGTIVASGAPIRDEKGQIIGSIATNQDITELRQAQATLQEVDRRKNEFLAVLSHELRNPLAPIRSSLYILEHAAPGGQQARRAHRVIERQVLHLTRLIDDLLDVTRISRGKVRLQRERVELCELAARVAEDHRSIFTIAGIQLQTRTCRAPLHVEGDTTRLSQIVGNLLANAAKFTPRTGTVELWVEREDKAAVVHVRDNGAGIASTLLSKLFEPFVQADATLDRSKGGLGLGLALVKGLVELHGGTVAARSEGAGKGAEFLVRLPLAGAESHADEPRPAASAPAPRRALHVLLIEDNLDAAESLREALELNGHRVDVATSGLEGIEKARVSVPDVVLCDIGLPGIDGFEVARRMRVDPRLRAACLVALSGYAAAEDLERSRDAGFVRHLAKPPDISQLESALSEALAACGGVPSASEEEGTAPA